MAKDYKPQAGKAAGSKGRGMNPMFMGIIIGLLMGVVLALGIAVWLNRSANPFIEKARPVEALPTLPPKPAVTPPPAAGKDGTEKPRFEFYQILPGEKDSSGQARKPAEPAAVPAAEKKHDPNRVNPTDTVNTTVRESYMLQAGAFQSETDAENLKAKIAFAGLEAMVRPVNVPDKGTLYRVRLGPYKSLEDVNRIKATLSQSGINASVVKAD
jgi:cell division protein FtsN